MVYQKIGASGATNGVGHWSPNKPMNVKPVITGEEKQDGVRFYVADTGVRYRVDAFDRMFGAPPQKVEKKKGKAKSLHTINNRK